jgi:hypothetical protein
MTTENYEAMTTNYEEMTTDRSSFRPLVSGLLGMTLLLPASFFMLTILVRAGFGSKALYYYIAPSFLQSPFDLFAWHKAQFILGCVLLAVVANGLALLQFRPERGRWGLDIRVSYRRRHWLNTAILLQGLLLLVTLAVYTLIQHIRY